MLGLHSWLRWAALFAGVAAVLAAARIRAGHSDQNRAAVASAEAWSLALVASVDLQMLLGLTLYLVLSPNMQAIREHFGEAMQNRQLRFWAVEHATMMMLAVVLVHVGRVLARKAETPAAKRMRMLVAFGLATLAMFAATPWPGLPYGRPLFRV